MVGRRWALLVSFFSDCFMEEAYEGGLDVISTMDQVEGHKD